MSAPTDGSYLRDRRVPYSGKSGRDTGGGSGPDPRFRPPPQPPSTGTVTTAADPDEQPVRPL
ncbi:hypothetical protein GCM10022225_16830 [Plantactinospora mayteni]|uniref:LytR family transcriptional regulator n=1 Tax=Plantactinospora mayteni TaxID=566021 RepID=A0ABQ4EGC0_9ACTN|nr:hypothetical protein Pma05_03300 [Plantactinospora mayteni]